MACKWSEVHEFVGSGGDLLMRATFRKHLERALFVVIVVCRTQMLALLRI